MKKINKKSSIKLSVFKHKREILIESCNIKKYNGKKIKIYFSFDTGTKFRIFIAPIFSTKICNIVKKEKSPTLFYFFYFSSSAL